MEIGRQCLGVFPSFNVIAKDCLIIANKLKELNDGSIWSSDWRVLTSVRWVKNKEWERQFEPSEIGKIFIKGLVTS